MAGPAVWKARYQTTDGKVSWAVEDVESRECPRSLLEREPETMTAIDRFYRAQRMHTALGGVLYGPDASLWPARWVDTVNVLSGEIEREDAVREIAFAEYRRRAQS